ncbi:MAG: HEAT repeat domain-containing protein, partial [Gemmatimonadota bacterium]|nr:HEAT repeat domain-containing protein [Gemmatimonadota bacterium]
DCDCACREGPVRIELRVEGGEILDLDTDVGGTWQDRRGEITNLGEIPPAEAVELLFRIAETAQEDVAEDAIFPATIARDIETWPRLLEIARGSAPSDVRRQAVFWLGQEASERATEGLTSIIESEAELGVREHAIFALSQREEEAAFEALVEIARDSGEPELRRKAIFWLGQKGDDPRVLRLLEDILSGGG